MTIDQAVERIQFAYPQIYYACHTRHVRQRSNAAHLSERDSAILVHLDGVASTTLSELARHLGLAISTLSEAVSRLENLGFLEKRPRHGTDRRQVGITLTPKAVSAVRAASVLDAERLRAALRRLPVADRSRVIDGLITLAQACRRGSS